MSRTERILMSIYRATCVTTLISLLAWTGCAETPRSGEASSSDVLDIGALANDFWLVREPLDLEPIKSPRIAIVEFTVEYVASPETDEGKDVDFGTGMKLELPGVLYQGFVDTLPEFDRHSVPLRAVSDASAYQTLEGTDIGDVALVSTAAKTGTRYPVDGLLCLESEKADIAVIAELLREVEADFALQVRLRVGVRDGRATIEKGSILRLIAEKGSGLVESKKTLISAQKVVEEEADSESLAIDSKRFVRAIQSLFRPCMAMALIKTGQEV